jgi:hypothetical protein
MPKPRSRRSASREAAVQHLGFDAVTDTIVPGRAFVI